MLKNGIKGVTVQILDEGGQNIDVSDEIIEIGYVEDILTTKTRFGKLGKLLMDDSRRRDPLHFSINIKGHKEFFLDGRVKQSACNVSKKGAVILDAVFDCNDGSMPNYDFDKLWEEEIESYDDRPPCPCEMCDNTPTPEAWQYYFKWHKDNLSETEYLEWSGE